MKKILILLLILAPLFINAQNSWWYKANAICFDDEEWEECDIRILIKDDCAKIYANETHTIRIIDIYDDGIYDESTTYRTWKCVDQEGDECLLTIVIGDIATMLSIQYQDFSVNYAIIPDD